jgi:hypothetical protein
MAISTAQPAIAQPSAAPTAEPCFLLSGTASDALRELSQRFPRLLTAQTMRGLPAKLPATRGYDFRNPRLLSEVLDRLCSDLKLPALVQVAQAWRKLRELPQAAVMTAEQWDAVLGGRAQLSSPARFARHGRPVEGWDSPWLADERAPYWGPAKCWLCAVHAGVGGIFYFPHDEPCAPQCSGADGRCGSPLCNGCCIPCIRGRDPECNGVCGAGGPCQVFIEDSPGSDDGVWEDPDAQPSGQQPAKAEALSGGPCLEGVPVASSLPKVLTDDAKRLAAPPSPTVKPQRKPLDVAGALAALRR